MTIHQTLCRGAFPAVLIALALGLAGCAEPLASSPKASKDAAPSTQPQVTPSPTTSAEPPVGADKQSSTTPPVETVAASPSPAPAEADKAPPAPEPAKVEPVKIEPNTTRLSRGAVAGRTRDITFDDLKFEMQKGDPFKRSMLTPNIEALEGQHVRLRGFILPSFQQTGIKQFVLVRDNMECCFGPGAALYDCVYIEMAPGKTADYTIYPVAVEGVFHIKEWVGPDGKHLAIYSMEGQQAK
jgi:hypothetical protein